MSFIERMIDKVDGPEEKKKADAEKGDDQSFAERVGESSGARSDSMPEPRAGFIPGLDGDLSDVELDALIDDKSDQVSSEHSPSTHMPSPVRARMSEDSGDDEFADHPLFKSTSAPASTPYPESEASAPGFRADNLGSSSTQDKGALGDHVQADVGHFDSPDAAFASVLSRYDHLSDGSWDDDTQSDEVPPQRDVNWDTRPEFLLPMGEEDSSLELSNGIGAEPVSEPEPEPEPHSGVEPSTKVLTAAEELYGEVVDHTTDEPGDPELALVDDESVPLEKVAEAQREEREGKIEAVGDDIGLPPELGIKRNPDELDDFDDLDDMDDFEAPPISSAMPAARTQERIATAKDAWSEPSDEFDDEDLDADDLREVDPRRVGNHVNLDLEHLADIGVVTPDNARGKVAEEYRLIKRPLLLNVIGEGEAEVEDPNIIMVTSSLPGEGKTFTSVNLAMSMAMELDRTVLLVDADVAKPSFSRVFDMETEGGLIDVLLGDATLEEVLLTTNVPKLRLLPAGRRHANSVELLASDHMRRLTKELATRYENRIIVFDSPPLLATTEAGVLASLMSQVVLVVEANKTPQYVVQESLKILDRSKYIGTVLNKSSTSGRSSYYYDYRYPYYYGYGQ